MGMTIAEKILARASRSASAAPGDFLVVDVDTIVLTDLVFKPTAREILKLHDPKRIVVIFDHNIPASDRLSAAAHAEGRAFVHRFGIERFHDVGATQGISHVVVADEAYALPGTVVICGDSHTCALGFLNCAARGVGAPEVMYAATTGTTWFRVGETVRYDLVGRLPPGVSSKDVFLHIAGTYGDHTNQNIEFGGEALANLNLNARRTLATMGAELSAEFVTFEPDGLLIDHIRSHNSASFEPQYPDPDARYAVRRTLDLSALEPFVALPDAVIWNSVPLNQALGEPIQQAFIGSCANGTLDDLRDAARVVRGRHVASGVRFIVTPGSNAILRAATFAGYVQTLTDAGAVVTPPTCGACFGGHMGVLGPVETCITASTRNFKGRMGDPSARIYMASSATVAASALAGRIASPSAFLECDP
jgi:3-isopropylmalate/(R)-2-methylmalate dehydratase large subunit